MLLDFMHERDTLELVHEDVPQQKNKLEILSLLDYIYHYLICQ
jgi:hypothetical protein